MKIDLAIKARILELCKEHNLTINKLSTQSMLTQSTLNGFMNSNKRYINIATLFKVCYGFNITIKEFFDSDSFENIDIEF